MSRLAERMRLHVQSRLDVTGKPSIRNGAWDMMLEAADTLDKQEAEIECLRAEILALRGAVR